MTNLFDRIFNSGNEIIEETDTQPQSNYYNSPDRIKYGRENIRKYLDGSQLIDDIAAVYGECLEELNVADKWQLIGEIAGTLYYLNLMENQHLNDEVEQVIQYLIQEIPFDSYKPLLAALLDDTGKPFRYFIDGFEAVDYICETWGENLEATTNIDHYRIISRLSWFAADMVTERIMIDEEDTTNICNRLHDLGRVSNGWYLMQAIHANI